MAARFFARWWTRKEASTAAQWEEPILKRDFEGHEDTIWSFIFLHDNVHIVSGSGDGTMRKWNCDTGLVVGEPWKEKGGRIFALALSPDGKVIACGREDGSVQRWTTDGEMITCVWTGDSKAVWSLSWSPSGSQIASGSEDGTILIRNADSGEIELGPIKTEHGWVRALAYSPSGERIASGGSNKTICIWDTVNTGELVVGPIKGLGTYVMSVVWSSDSTKLYSASKRLARVFDSNSGEVLHSFQHDNNLWSVAFSPKNNVLACVGLQGVVQLWDTESHNPLGKPFRQEHHAGWLLRISFSQDEKYLAYNGYDKKITLWMIKDIAPQLATLTLLEQSDRQRTQRETQSHSPSSSCLDADATGGDCNIEEAHDDPYHNFFQSSLPSASTGSHIPHLFSARRFLNVFSRRHPSADKSVPQERSKRGFFARHACSDSPLELATIQPNQPVPEVKVRDGEGEQDENVDRGSANDLLNTRKDKGTRDDPPARVQNLPFDDRTPTTNLDSRDNRTFWEWLMQARGQKLISGFLYSSTRPSNAPKPIPVQPWHWNSSIFPVGSSPPRVDVAACREEDRYGITSESDAEAAAAMQRTNDDVADSSTRPGQPAVGAQVSQGRPTQAQTQASTSGPEDKVYEGVSCCGFFFGYRRRSNSHQP